MKVNDVTRISAVASLSFVLSMIKIQFSSGGSVHLGLIPIMLYSVFSSWRHSVTAGFLFGMLKIVSASPKGLVNIFQIILEYPVSYGILGFCGIFSTLSDDKQKFSWKNGFFLMSFSIGIIRFFIHTASSRYFFNYDWIPSMIYNSAYIIPTTIAGIVGVIFSAPKLINKWGKN
jgi:thiamine transporter